jgi:hypothetical protein
MGGYDFRLFPINCFYPCCWGAYGGHCLEREYNFLFFFSFQSLVL